MVIEENIITIRKRIKGRFLTNSPVIATTANSLRPVGANLKCMISILQTCIQNRPTFTIRSNAIIQLQQEVYYFINLLFCGTSQMDIKIKSKVFPINQTMMQLLHLPLTIELESKTHTQSNNNKKIPII